MRLKGCSASSVKVDLFPVNTPRPTLHPHFSSRSHGCRVEGAPARNKRIRVLSALKTGSQRQACLRRSQNSPADKLVREKQIKTRKNRLMKSNVLLVLFRIVSSLFSLSLQDLWFRTRWAEGEVTAIP